MILPDPDAVFAVAFSAAFGLSLGVGCGYVITHILRGFADALLGYEPHVIRLEVSADVSTDLER